MHILFPPHCHPLLLALTLTGLCCCAPARAADNSDTKPALVDDFADAKRTARGVDRLLFDDQSLGGKSQATQTCTEGVLAMKGELVPGRGAPAFISLVLLLAPEGRPQDLSGYTGVRLRVKILKGSVCVQVTTPEVQNMDYHTSAPLAVKRGEFQEVRMPFKDMKRAWSEQTAINQKALASVNLVTVGMVREDFAYEVDEIGFY